MTNKTNVWNLLHDGTIAQIEGVLPNVNIRVEIEYLRHIFSNDGESIILEIRDCSLLQYKKFENSELITDFDSIIDLEPEILSSEEEKDKLRIICVEGVFEIEYGDISFKLDNGNIVTLDEIQVASDTYWDRWEKSYKDN